MMMSKLLLQIKLVENELVMKYVQLSLLLHKMA